MPEIVTPGMTGGEATDQPVPYRSVPLAPPRGAKILRTRPDIVLWPRQVTAPHPEILTRKPATVKRRDRLPALMFNFGERSKHLAATFPCFP